MANVSQKISLDLLANIKANPIGFEQTIAKFKDFVKQNNFADATDMNGNYLLSTYRKGQIKNTQKEQPIQIKLEKQSILLVAADF